MIPTATFPAETIRASLADTGWLALIRPRIGLALGWIAYGLFYAAVAGSVVAPVALAVRVWSVRFG